MENQEGQEKPVEEVVVDEAKAEGVVEEAPQETEREKNLKAENARKAAEIQRLRAEMETARRPAKQASDVNDPSTWKDHELKAALKDPQWAHMHDAAQDEIEKRRFQRFQAQKEEETLHLNSELERQEKYPETLDPTHPMAVRMSQLMHSYRLSNTPAGRLVAARLAASELKPSKAVAAGREQERNRQADVKANFQGEPSRPAPKVSDKVKLEELKKRAMSGDKAAQAEWFKQRGII